MVVEDLVLICCLFIFGYLVIVIDFFLWGKFC